MNHRTSMQSQNCKLIEWFAHIQLYTWIITQVCNCKIANQLNGLRIYNCTLESSQNCKLFRRAHRHKMQWHILVHILVQIGAYCTSCYRKNNCSGRTAQVQHQHEWWVKTPCPYEQRTFSLFSHNTKLQPLNSSMSPGVNSSKFLKPQTFLRRSSPKFTLVRTRIELETEQCSVTWGFGSHVFLVKSIVMWGHAIVFLRQEGNPGKDQGMACMMNVQRLEYKTLQGRPLKIDNWNW